MSDDKSWIEFNNLAKKYQECLNTYYDKYLNGVIVNLDNSICSEYRNNLKTFKYFKEMEDSFQDHLKNKNIKLDNDTK